MNDIRSAFEFPTCDRTDYDTIRDVERVIDICHRHGFRNVKKLIDQLTPAAVKQFHSRVMEKAEN